MFFARDFCTSGSTGLSPITGLKPEALGIKAYPCWILVRSVSAPTGCSPPGGRRFRHDQAMQVVVASAARKGRTHLRENLAGGAPKRFSGGSGGRLRGAHVGGRRRGLSPAQQPLGPRSRVWPGRVEKKSPGRGWSQLILVGFLCKAESPRHRTALLTSLPALRWPSTSLDSLQPNGRRLATSLQGNTTLKRSVASSLPTKVAVVKKRYLPPHFVVFFATAIA